MPNEKPDFEDRLDDLRREAKHGGAVTARGVDVAGGPIPHWPGYYGEAVVRPPVWSWEIPLYFFIGGAAGMAPLIACAGWFFGQLELMRAALWIVGAGAFISPLLLIMDLGRPALFLNMLRVFKHRSPMSVGAWILSLFGTVAGPAFLLSELYFNHAFAPSIEPLIFILTGLLTIGAAVAGLGLATYTGVLLGATVIPAWFLHRVLLPIHFGTAGLGCAAATLELLGFQIRQLFLLGMLAAMIETLLWIWLELDKHGAGDRALHEGRAGWLIRGGEILCGPLPLLLRLTNLVPFAALSFLLGALLSRFGWIEAGRVSGRDPEAVFSTQRHD
ncbi:MAG: polysulfide reductase NrfD [Chthoniobacterales bacterium]|nr:polysulfide reductase NrfD [Chthoniobacterales bacterium]